MDNITVGQIMAAVVAIAGFISALTIIVKAVKKPIDSIQSKLDGFETRFDCIDNKLSSLDVRMISLEGKQLKLTNDVRMNMVLARYLLNANTDSTEAGKKIREQYDAYIMEQALGGEGGSRNGER